MPFKSKHACYRSGCTNLTIDTYCPEHTIDIVDARKRALAEADKRRGNANSRGYGYRHNQQRKKFLRNNPLCEVHKSHGWAVAATIYHHRNGNQYDTSEKNKSALCYNCHESIHGRRGFVAGWFDKISEYLGYCVRMAARGLINIYTGET